MGGVTALEVLLRALSPGFPYALAVVLTGANSDGAAGVARIKAVGGTGLVQDPATAEARAMPLAAIAAAEVDRVLALADLADALHQLRRPALARAPHPRRTPSFFIRLWSVVGLIPSSRAAPSAP